MDPIYLDNNATTPIDPRVPKTIHECHEAGYVNPASQHRLGQKARQVMESRRTQILEILGAKTTGMDADRLIVTSGGTESNNLALFGLVPNDTPTKRVLVSAIEHPSLLAPCEFMRQQGYEVELVPVDRDCRLRLDVLEELLEKPTDLVSIMLANNETGTIQPIRQVVEMCRKREVTVHTDAVQAVGKLPVNFRELGVDAMTITAHKLHGPRGIGGLILRPGIQPQPILYGGFQQMGVRPGTEDVSLLSGFATALEIYRETGPESAQRMATFRDELQQNLSAEIPDMVVNGHSQELGAENRVPHTLNVSFPGINRQALLMATDMNGLAISTGSACASGASDPSHVIMAMEAPADVVEGSIRISLGNQTTHEEIRQAGEIIVRLVRQLRQQNKP